MKEEYCPVCLPDDNLILVKLRCGHKICQGLERVIRLSGENMTIKIDPEIHRLKAINTVWRVNDVMNRSIPL